MSSTGADSDDHDQTGTPSDYDVSEMVTAGPTTLTQSSSSSHGGPEAMSPNTGALEQSGVALARSADDVSVRAATGVTTSTQSNPRRSSQAET